MTFLSQTDNFYHLHKLKCTGILYIMLLDIELTVKKNEKDKQ